MSNSEINETETILSVDDLHTYYRTDEGDVHAVDGVDIDLSRNESLGLVGESGCGKTTLAKTLIKLLPKNGEIVGGSIDLEGVEITDLSDKELRQDVRWSEISMIPQVAMNGLDPVKTVGRQIVNVIIRHEDVSKDKAWERARILFEKVGLDPDRVTDYPHQFSGGMAQRAMIALALALSPSIILADEPTTALDVMIQDRIMRQIDALQDEFDTAMILITHDISVVAENCDRIVVMYGGKVAEYGDTATILTDPKHPYTMGLRNAFPDIKEDDQELVSIPGEPPTLVEPDEGCRFAPRCPFAEDQCWEETPEPEEHGDGHIVRCHRADEYEELQERAYLTETWRETEAAVETDTQTDQSKQPTEASDD